MGENEMKVKGISTSSSEMEGNRNVILLEEEEEEGTPLRPIFCLKKNMDMKEFEETEDCFILDFDPFESLDLSKLSMSKDDDDDDNDHDDDDNDDFDLTVVAERGQVACRDYPHSRHLCLKFPFENSPHESYCEMCYCYVCDLAAPCEYWIKPQTGHCHAAEHVGDWKLQRKQVQAFRDEKLVSS